MATPSTDNALGETAAEQIASLMDQVRSKDTLVMQLTERLEQAAEQLDRLHRSGADKRHGGGGGGGGSRELVEQTGALTTRVEEALEAWNQTGPQFDYICQRLDEIAGSLQGGATPSKGNSRSSSPSLAPASAAPATGAAGGSFWEKMKSNMMDGSPAPSATPASTAPASPGQSPSAEGTEGAATSSDVFLQRISAPAPTVIEVETASIEELREAVTTRDNYISAIISELRTAEPFPTLPSDLKESGIAPEELVASLLEMESRLKTKMLREELDLSLERARIARERSKLELVKTQLESQIKRLSGSVGPAESSGADQASAADDPATGKLSWLKRLKGNK